MLEEFTFHILELIVYEAIIRSLSQYGIFNTVKLTNTLTLSSWKKLKSMQLISIAKLMESAVQNNVNTLTYVSTLQARGRTPQHATINSQTHIRRIRKNIIYFCVTWKCINSLWFGVRNVTQKCRNVTQNKGSKHFNRCLNYSELLSTRTQYCSSRGVNVMDFSKGRSLFEMYSN